MPYPFLREARDFTPAPKNRCKLAQMGCYLEYDTFGTDGLCPIWMAPFDVTIDIIAVNEIINLISDGYLNNILISQDVCYQINLNAYGGASYTHL